MNDIGGHLVSLINIVSQGLIIGWSWQQLAQSIYLAQHPANTPEKVVGLPVLMTGESFFFFASVCQKKAISVKRSSFSLLVSALNWKYLRVEVTVKTQSNSWSYEGDVVGVVGGHCGVVGGTKWTEDLTILTRLFSHTFVCCRFLSLVYFTIFLTKWLA